MAEAGLVDRLSPGHKDDGTDTGVVLVRNLGQNLVRVPIRNTETLLTTSTAGTAGVTNALANPDGTGLGISLAAPQVVGSTTSSATVETTLWGTRIGVRLTRTSTTAPFTLIVDGVPYRVDATRNRRYAAASLSVNDSEAMFIVADDLAPGPHNVVVALVGQPAGGDGSSRAVGLLGWVADSNFYEPNPRAAIVPSAPVAVPTTAGIIPAVTRLGLFYGFDFINSAATAANVQLSLGGAANQWRNVPVPASAGGINGTASIVLPAPVQSMASVQGRRWVASAAGVTAVTYEASA